MSDVAIGAGDTYILRGDFKLRRHRDPGGSPWQALDDLTVSLGGVSFDGYASEVVDGVLAAFWVPALRTQFRLSISDTASSPAPRDVAFELVGKTIIAVEKIDDFRRGLSVKLVCVAPGVRRSTLAYEFDRAPYDRCLPFAFDPVLLLGNPVESVDQVDGGWIIRVNGNAVYVFGKNFRRADL